MGCVQTVAGLIMLLCAQPTFAKNTRFHNFFPVYRKNFTDTRDGPCLQYFEMKEEGATVCHELLNCMLENTSEVIKGDMASGIVALGLMPTVLIFLGSGISETALLARRRPLLALLIAAGSPSVNPLPTFVYPNPIKELRAREGHLVPKYFTPWQAALVSILQYGLVIGAVANLYTTAFYTGYWTINAISCDTTWFQTLWAVLTLPIHLFGVWALALRVKTVRNKARQHDKNPNRVLQWLKHETKPCVTHEKIALTWKPETYLFVVVSWWTSIITATHVLWGTIAFSSIQFLGKYLRCILS
jgi:hypothetical protein